MAKKKATKWWPWLLGAVAIGSGIGIVAWAWRSKASKAAPDLGLIGQQALGGGVAVPEAFRLAEAVAVPSAAPPVATPVEEPAPTYAIVDIYNDAFHPPDLEVSRGATVLFRNRDANLYSVTFDGQDYELSPGEQVEVGFPAAGRYQIVDRYQIAGPAAVVTVS